MPVHSASNRWMGLQNLCSSRAKFRTSAVKLENSKRAVTGKFQALAWGRWNGHREPPVSSPCPSAWQITVRRVSRSRAVETGRSRQTDPANRVREARHFALARDRTADVASMEGSQLRGRISAMPTTGSLQRSARVAEAMSESGAPRVVNRPRTARRGQPRIRSQAGTKAFP